MSDSRDRTLEEGAPEGESEEESEGEDSKEPLLGHEDLSLYVASKEHGEFLPCLAAVVFPCGWTAQQEVETYGAHGDDHEFMDQSFSLLSGLTPSSDKKIEIEDVRGPEDCVQTARHLRQIINACLITGALLWALIFIVNVAVYASGLALLLPLGFGMSALFLLYRLSSVTQLLNETAFEGRPFCRIMNTLSGLGSYRFLTVFALLDLNGKFTRANFVVKALLISDTQRSRFETLMEQRGDVLSSMQAAIGFGGIAALAFAFGWLLQLAFMAYSAHNVDGHVEDDDDAYADHGGGFGIQMYMDDFDAIADWAVLKPASQVFSRAALPARWEDDNDALRVWDLMRTETVRTVVHIVPDTIVSLSLQATFFSLSYDDLSQIERIRAVCAFLASWIPAMITVLKLFKQNHVITVASAVLLMFLTVDPLARIVGVFACSSHALDLTFTCVNK